MPDQGVRRACIVGLGLMGTSLGLAVRARAPHVDLVGFDTCSHSADYALAIGAVCALGSSDVEATRGADVVVLAVPVGAVALVARSLASTADPDAAITDLGSTKARLVAECEAALGARFVGGHPMAGSERSGPGSASATILEGAPWILTPTERTSRQALARVDALVRLATGRAPQRMSPDAHDRFAAYVSHAAHAVAYALAASARRELGADIEDAVGGSYRSLARIARSDPRFWATILCDNAAHVSDALEDVILHMTTLRRHIEIGDVEAVRQHLAAGTAQATADG